jgi:UDP-N-acetylmuramyl pentapeptide phosphotransferase/UDP-N-acetylglucosamine-1-phosphate transferase
VVVVGVVLVAAIDSIRASAVGAGMSELRRAGDLLLVGSLGFALLGLFDDLVGATEVKGFRGHLGALRQGRVTSGLLKLLGGLALGVLCAPGDLGSSIRGGLLIAAMANLANLFDRAPGRVIKVGIIGAGIVGAVGGLGWAIAPTMLVVGAGAGLLLADLREECMLGDTGSNVLGAAVGYGLVVGLSSTGEWVALAVVVAANLMSERVSFTAVIDRTAPLRWLDRLGCRPERRRT